MPNLLKNLPAEAAANVLNMPQNDFAWQNLGVFYQNSGHFAKAIESFNQALAVRSGASLAEILANLAIVYQKMGQLDLAESCLLDALAETPENPTYLDQMKALKSLG